MVENIDARSRWEFDGRYKVVDACNDVLQCEAFVRFELSDACDVLNNVHALVSSSLQDGILVTCVRSSFETLRSSCC